MIPTGDKEEAEGAESPKNPLSPEQTCGKRGGDGASRHLPLILLIILSLCFLAATVVLSIRLAQVSLHCDRDKAHPGKLWHEKDINLSHILNSKAFHMMETHLRNTTVALLNTQADLKKSHELQQFSIQQEVALRNQVKKLELVIDGYKKNVNRLDNELTQKENTLISCRRRQDEGNENLQDLVKERLQDQDNERLQDQGNERPKDQREDAQTSRDSEENLCKTDSKLNDRENNLERDRRSPNAGEKSAKRDRRELNDKETIQRRTKECFNFLSRLCDCPEKWEQLGDLCPYFSKDKASRNQNELE